MCTVSIEASKGDIHETVPGAVYDEILQNTVFQYCNTFAHYLKSSFVVARGVQEISLSCQINYALNFKTGVSFS